MTIAKAASVTSNPIIEHVIPRLALVTLSVLPCESINEMLDIIITTTAMIPTHTPVRVGLRRGGIGALPTPKMVKNIMGTAPLYLFFD